MADSQDQWNTTDENKILSDELPLDSFPAISKRRSYYEPSEDCFPYLIDDPICVPSKTPIPNHGEQSSQPMSTYGQENTWDRTRIHSDNAHINPAYLNHSFDYLNHDHIPHPHNSSVGFPSAPTYSYNGGPRVQRHQGDTYPNPQHYYLPQHSQAIQQQPQVIYIVAQPPVNSESFESSDVDGSIYGAIALAIFSTLACPTTGIAALIMASE